MKCPGQDMKYWKENAIFDVACPKCQAPVEFYKDDTSRRCGSCGHRFVNPKMDFGCASYCQYAEQCIGTLPEDFSGVKDALLKDKIAVEIKRHFHTDFKSIRQAASLARLAEIIGKAEGGAKLAIILCAAYLCDVDPTEARSILQRVGAGQQMIEEIGHLQSKRLAADACDSLPESILHDARLLRDMQEELKDGTSGPEYVQEQAARLITASAKGMASSLLGRGATGLD